MVCMGSPDTAQAPALPSTTPPAFDVYQTGLDGKTVNRLRDVRSLVPLSELLTFLLPPLQCVT